MKKFTKQEFIDEVVEQLREWGNGETIPEYPELGLCAVLTVKFDIHGNLLVQHLCEGWKHFSGSLIHPVKADIRDESYTVGTKRRASSQYRMVANLWGSTQYSDMRRDLCHHIADGLEEWWRELDC